MSRRSSGDRRRVKRKATRRGCGAVCQALERRRLLAVTASLNGLGTLNVSFNAQGDSVTLTANAASGNGFLVSGTGLAATSFSGVTGIDVNNGSPSLSVSATVNNLTGDPLNLSKSIVFFGINSVSFSETLPVSALSVVDTTSPITLNVPSITTSGVQQFGAAVALASDVTLKSIGGGNITFSSTLNGAHALTVDTAGGTTFAGTVGGSTRLGSLTTDSPGSTSIGATINTSSAQSYQDPVTLTANSNLVASAGSIDFARTLDGAFALATNGLTEFDSAVGATTPLSSLTVSSTGFSFQRAGITTSGNQSYTGTFDLGVGGTTNAFVSTAGGNITFAGPMDGTNLPLTVKTAGITTFGGAITHVTTLVTDAPGSTHLGASIGTSGSQTFNDPVSLTGNATLSSSGSDISFPSTVDGAFALSVNASGNVTFAGLVGSTTPLASLTTGAGGTARVNTAAISTSGSQTYGGPVVLGANWTADSTGGGDIIFNSSVDGPFPLTAATSGNTAFHGIVGGNAPLSTLSTQSGGSALLAGAALTTQGTQVYRGPVTLGANCTLTLLTTSSTTFDGTIDGGFALTVNAAGINVLAAVGATIPLSGLTLNAGEAFFTGGSITTTGNQSYAGRFQLGANSTLVSNGAGNITFGSAVEATTTPFSLTVNTGGTTTFNGAVGATHQLQSLTTDAPGMTVLGGGSVHTAQNQTYSDAVVLSLDTDLSATPAGMIQFDGSLNGPHALTLEGVGAILHGPVGGTTPPANLSILANFASLGGGAITTAGAQFFDSAVNLLSDMVLSSVGAGPNDITFRSTVEGAHALTIAAGTGRVDLLGAVGGTTPLTALTIASANDVNAFGGITAGTIVQASGLGTSTFGGTLHATGPVGISLTGHAFSLSVVNVDHGSLSIADIGAATAMGAISAAGGLTKAGPGTLALAQTNHYPGLTDVSGGTLQFNARQALTGGLHVAGGATAVLGAGNLLTTSAIAFDGSPGAPQGRLDLTNGQLLISFGNTPDPISAISANIAAGFNHGSWNGQGILSSTAAADPSRLGSGYSDGIDGVVPGLTPGNIMVKLALLGDVNLDGAVNFADLLALAQHFGQSNATWDRGDLNYDGSVAFPDLLTLAQHFGQSAAAGPPEGAAVAFDHPLLSRPRRERTH